MPSPRRLGRSLVFLSGLRLVFNTAQRFVYPFLPAISRGLGISLEQAGLLVSIRWLAGLATPGIVAVGGRGEQRRRLVVAGILLFVAGAVVTAATGVWVGAVIGFALMGLAKPVYDISAQAYIADRTPYATRARFLAIMELTWAGGLLVGAPAAGWLIEQAGWSTPFWVFAGLAAASLFLVGGAIDRDAAAPPSRAKMRLDRSAVALLGVVALFTLAAEVMFVVFGAWLEDGFGLSLLELGGLAAVVGFAELTGEGATLAFTDRIGKRRAVAAGLVISAVGFAALAVTESSLVAGMTAVAVGLAGFEFTIVSNIPLATEVKPDARARFLSLLIVATAVGRTIGTATGPIIFGRFGLAGNAFAAAVADVLALGVLLVFVRESGATHHEPPILFLPE